MPRNYFLAVIETGNITSPQGNLPQLYVVVAPIADYPNLPPNYRTGKTVNSPVLFKEEFQFFGTVSDFEDNLLDDFTPLAIEVSSAIHGRRGTETNKYTSARPYFDRDGKAFALRIGVKKEDIPKLKETSKTLVEKLKAA